MQLFSVCKWPSKNTVQRLQKRCRRVFLQRVNGFLRDFGKLSATFKSEVESRTQGSRPRPRPRTAFPRTDALEAKDRNARGQGQGPRTQSASALRKKKKKVFTKIFQAISKKKKKKRSSQKFFKRSPLKNVFQTIFQALHKILTFQKIVLSSSRGQANFRGLEASRPRPRT